jgi:hypothetical protein
MGSHHPGIYRTLQRRRFFSAQGLWVEARWTKLLGSWFWYGKYRRLADTELTDIADTAKLLAAGSFCAILASILGLLWYDILTSQ